LYKLGYRNKGDLEQAMYRYLQAEDNLVAARNALKKAMAEFNKLEAFEYRMELARLRGALESAKRKLEQVQRDNEAKEAEAKAAKIAAEREFEKEEEQLKKYETQLEKCKIYAPHDGMVVYATRGRWGQTVDIQEGAFVRERQKILELPDLSRMQVKTTVHESVLDQVKVGLPAMIKVDAFPDRVYEGTVKSVAVLPNPGGWLSSDIKVYETIVTIDEEVEELKPGMTAVVEIHIDRLRDVLSVPIQAIVERNNETWCFVMDEGGDIVKRRIMLGRSNDKFVHVKSGIREGEQVVLNPMAILGEEAESEKEELSPDAESDLLKNAAKRKGKQTARQQKPRSGKAGKAAKKKPQESSIRQTNESRIKEKRQTERNSNPERKERAGQREARPAADGPKQQKKEPKAEKTNRKPGPSETGNGSS
ncbi:MAG TPA: efflux RND transporter periplasmic adaptor subunit, partial [Planctomycetaceae bacterium]|nr:efflux RND transporter periplasmic adaptor subunit [Planctomycetaceae bacterium]